MRYVRLSLVNLGLLLAATAGISWFLADQTFPDHFEDVAYPASLGVQELTAKLRRELETMELDRRRAGSTPLFEVTGFDLEVGFVIERSRQGQGGVKYEVVTLSGERRESREQAHRINLHLKAVPIRSVTVAPSAQPFVTPPDAVELPPK